MNINIKEQVIRHLFKSGHIDNKSKSISKGLADEVLKAKNNIIQSYDIIYKNTSIKEFVNNISIQSTVSIPLIKNTNIIAEPIILLNNECDIEEDIEKIPEELYKAQLSELKLYSYIYMKNKNIDKIELKLIFQCIDDLVITEKTLEVYFDESEKFFIETIEKYIRWLELTERWSKERNITIKKLKFPFSTYRPGQENLAKGTYTTIAQNKQLFVQAPTGIGKTISTVYPSVKAIGENKIEKIFYLTAKTIGAKVAEESFDKMRTDGLKFRNITLTAKDKVCFLGKANCNPESCDYAKHYYNKITDVIYEMLEKESNFTREVIDGYAKKYKVCPYELSLDLSLYSDAIICDYNYVFDPNVYLKRYFENNDKCNCVFLIDEAHNLVDRARSMYSGELNKSKLVATLESISPDFKKIENSILKVIKEISVYEDKCTEGKYSQTEMPHKLANAISELSDVLSFTLNKEKFLSSKQSEVIYDLYSCCSRFIDIAELYDNCYVFYIEKKEDTLIKLFCVDPSKNLREAYKRGKSAIVFSATLSPLKYFRDILGGEEDAYGVILSSPFDVKNREILVVDNVSTRFKDREKSYDIIVEYIHAMTSKKVGNYMVFLPSFDYMNKIRDKFYSKYPFVKTIKQDQHMSELDREIYLSKFSKRPKETMISFNVVSGLFSEGVDFKGEMLIGSIIVSVGLPMICQERDIIKNYFQEQNGYGFDFAYTFPGINKVIQSAGRVIRTDEDKGIIMLIDDRFGTNKYKSLFPREWSNHKTVRSLYETENIISGFWSQNK